MNFNELTRARYSLRKFDPRPIEEEKLRLLLQAAQSAPTAHNNQPQYLLVCKSPDALARVDRCTTIATAQIMLQAADLGLGSTYVGVFDPEKLALELPELAGRTPIALLPVGYPAPDAHPSKLHTQRKPLEEFYTEL